MASEREAGVVAIWTFRQDVSYAGADLTDFEVEARDGKIGKIDEATAEAGSSYIVVDTGPWILGKKVMLPAGVIRGVDRDKKLVHVDRTKDEIKSAPSSDGARTTTIGAGWATTTPASRLPGSARASASTGPSGKGRDRAPRC